MLPAIWHRYIFLFGIIGLASGMLFGTVPTSIPQIIIAGNWLLEKNFDYKWQQLKSNKVFWVLLCLFVLHLIGMFYTSNIHRGLEDLRNKVPLLILPLLIFSTKPLSQKEFKLLFYFFFASVLVSSAWCFIVYCGYTHKVIIDAREASVFMSHIRFSLFIAFAIIGLIYYFIKESVLFHKIMGACIILWLLFFMYKLQLVTGFVFLIVVGVALIFKLIVQRFSLKGSFVFICLFIVLSLVFVIKIKKSLSMFDKSERSVANTMFLQTVNQSNYLHDTTFHLAENGNLIAINICDYELRKEWELKSKRSYYGDDKKGNGIRYSLIRYLASKGLTKDSMGIKSLTPKDISNVEQGFTNYKYVSNSGFMGRWRELVWEYTKYKRQENPSGHTLTMRIEFWKTALYIINRHSLFGVGTGDVQDAFNKAYAKTNSKLDSHWRLRCHNQYLAITVAFGMIGFIIFLFYLIYPAILLRTTLHPLYWPFFFIALLSFLTEDTLETQSGVTFFIFFQTLFLWLASYREQEKN